MKKIIILLMFIITIPAFAQVKISALDANTTFDDSSMFVIVWDSSGTSVSRKLYMVDLEGFMRDSLHVSSAIDSSMFAQWSNVVVTYGTQTIYGYKTFQDTVLLYSGLMDIDGNSKMRLYGTMDLIVGSKIDLFKLSKIPDINTFDTTFASSLDSIVVVFDSTFTDPLITFSNEKPWAAYLKTNFGDSASFAPFDYGVGDSCKIKGLVYEQ